MNPPSQRIRGLRAGLSGAIALAGGAALLLLSYPPDAIEVRFERGQWALGDDAARQFDGFLDSRGANARSRSAVDEAGRPSRGESYLRRQVAASPYAVEIFFTDRKGFHVEMSSLERGAPRSDGGRKENGRMHATAMGEVGYDESARLWSVAISIPVDGKTELGVMKSVQSMEPVRRVAGRDARGVPGSAR